RRGAGALRPRGDRQGRPDRGRGPAVGAQRAAPVVPRQLSAERLARGARDRLPRAHRRGRVGGACDVSTAALTWRQFRFERKMFWRNPSAAFFNFTLPFLFLILIASVFGADRKELDILIPGIAGLSVLGTTFTALAYTFVFNREQGILKRIRGTPQPPISYFGGVIASAVANAIVQVALIVVIGHVLYNVSWPKDYFELVVFVVLGVVAFGSLGIAFAQAIPNFDAAAAYVNAVFLPVIFISGTFYSTDSMPELLKAIA